MTSCLAHRGTRLLHCSLNSRKTMSQNVNWNEDFVVRLGFRGAEYVRPKTLGYNSLRCFAGSLQVLLSNGITASDQPNPGTVSQIGPEPVNQCRYAVSRSD